MIYHVLPGDAQVKDFRATGIDGEVIVFREAFIIGPIQGADRDEFWSRRARYILSEYGEDEIDYQEKVADELLKLDAAGQGDELNLWFEYELFCSVNYWYCLDRLRGKGCTVFRVSPNPVPSHDAWAGFGAHTKDDLKACFDGRIRLSDPDVDTGSKLWHAYATRDNARLRQMGAYSSPAFALLEEVCDAAADIGSRPLEVIREILAAGKRSIDDVFPEFKRRAGVYGFGDRQVQRLMNAA
jgi:hypothetical protein